MAHIFACRQKKTDMQQNNQAKTTNIFKIELAFPKLFLFYLNTSYIIFLPRKFNYSIIVLLYAF